MLTQSHIKKFKEENYRFVLFSGSWCPTCILSLPKIMKLIAKFDLGKKEVEIYEVEPGKSEPKNPIQKYNIHFVPTLLIYSGNVEIGKVIEYPSKSWEEDVAEILSKS